MKILKFQAVSKMFHLHQGRIHDYKRDQRERRSPQKKKIALSEFKEESQQGTTTPELNKFRKEPVLMGVYLDDLQGVN